MATPTPGKIIPARSLQNANLLNLCQTRRQQALNFYNPFHAKTARRYDLFRGYYRRDSSAGRNNVHLPMLFALIEADVSRKVQALFGGPQIVEFVGPDSSIARKNSALVSAQLEACGSYQKATDFFTSAAVYGTGFGKVTWKTIRRKESWRELDENGNEFVNKGMVTRFDGPNWEVVDLLDLWPQPGRRTIQECMWVMDRYYMDLQEIEQRVEMDVFDKAGLQMLRASGGMPTEIDSAKDVRFNIYRSQAEFEARRAEKFAKPVELVDMWGLVPDEFAVNGTTFCLITIANNNVILRHREFPYGHGELPFISHSPMRDPHYLHGIGKIEAAEKLQYLANRFASQKADALDRFIDPVVLVNRLAGLDEQNIYTRPGRVIGLDGPVSEDMIRFLHPDLRGVQYAMTEIESLFRFAQLALGLKEDTDLGGTPQSSRESATSWAGRREASSYRLQQEVRLAEEEVVERIANQFRGLNRQLLKLPHAIRILGEAAEIDPITGRPITPEPTLVDLSDLNPTDIVARAKGASQMLGMVQKQQNLAGLLSMVSPQANPAAASAINWAAMLMYTFQTFEMPNPADFLVKAEEPKSELTQTAEAAGNGGATSGIGLEQILGGGGF